MENFTEQMNGQDQYSPNKKLFNPTATDTTLALTHPYIMLSAWKGIIMCNVS